MRQKPLAPPIGWGNWTFTGITSLSEPLSPVPLPAQEHLPDLKQFGP